MTKNVAACSQHISWHSEVLNYRNGMQKMKTSEWQSNEMVRCEISNNLGNRTAYAERSAGQPSLLEFFGIGVGKIEKRHHDWLSPWMSGLTPEWLLLATGLDARQQGSHLIAMGIRHLSFIHLSPLSLFVSYSVDFNHRLPRLDQIMCDSWLALSTRWQGFKDFVSLSFCVTLFC